MMNMSNGEKVSLKKWAFGRAQEIAERNASVLTTKREPVDYDNIEKTAQRLFDWATHESLKTE